MRTTVTLDDDAAALVRQRMREHGVSFKAALNDAIRAGAAPRTDFRTEPADLGTPSVNLDQALRLAGALEDEESIRKLRLGK